MIFIGAVKMPDVAEIDSLVPRDTLWNEDGCLFTAFVALQAVTRPMGPTRFLLGTHADAATHEAFEDGQEDGSFLADGGFEPACGISTA